MAQFRGTLSGSRGEASRLGSAKTGLVARVNGWDSGVRVEASVENGHDVFRIFITSGSNARHGSACIGRVETLGVGGVPLFTKASA